MAFSSVCLVGDEGHWPDWRNGKMVRSAEGRALRLEKEVSDDLLDEVLWRGESGGSFLANGFRGGSRAVPSEAERESSALCASPMGGSGFLIEIWSRLSSDS